MTQQTDWMPSGRGNQLFMARTWISVFTEDTPNPAGSGSTPATVKQYTAWGISAEIFTEFTMCFGAVEETLTTAQKEETRTPVATAACRSAFKTLAELMRYIKKRWLISPPLTDADMIRLGFKLVDKKPTPSGPPTAKILPEIISRGQASLKIRFEYVEGNANDKANKSRRLHYKIIPHGETLPATPDELTKSRPMNRRIETFAFEYGDSGKVVYMAVQLENGDMKGPWGPMINAVIP